MLFWRYHSSANSANYLASFTAKFKSSSGGNCSLSKLTRACLTLKLSTWPKICLSKREMFLKVGFSGGSSGFTRAFLLLYINLVIRSRELTPVLIVLGSKHFCSLGWDFILLSSSISLWARLYGLHVKSNILFMPILTRWSIFRPSISKSFHLFLSPNLFLSYSIIVS